MNLLSEIEPFSSQHSGLDLKNYQFQLLQSRHAVSRIDKKSRIVYLDLFLGCNFLNRTIEDGHSTHIGFGEMPYCMTCSCLLRKLECTSIEVSQRVSNCISEQQCKSMSTHVKDSEYTEYAVRSECIS